MRALQALKPEHGASIGPNLPLASNPNTFSRHRA